ncbi:MAG: SDR family oxidoreductase [Eubacteriaceae bacterium]|nr:SDR family oxidoreductase [Eubacteriaceae bacterium]
MRIVITGTAAGIGKACAERFISSGHEVYGYDVEESTLDHPLYHHFIHDIAGEQTPPVIGCEILINNAGTLTEENAIETNLLGTIRFTEAFKDSVSLKSILFIASASARNGSEFPLYVASKAGIVGYMKNLALNLGKRGITCNSISPGGVVTASNGHIINDPVLYAAVKAETLLGKWAQPEEVAELAYYLTVQNRSITGEDILMDNGEMLRSNFIW